MKMREDWDYSSDFRADGADGGAERVASWRRALAQNAVAVAVVGLAGETDVAGDGDFFLDAAQVGAELLVVRDAKFALLEVAAESEGQALLDRRR